MSETNPLLLTATVVIVVLCGQMGFNALKESGLSWGDIWHKAMGYLTEWAIALCIGFVLYEIILAIYVKEPQKPLSVTHPGIAYFQPGIFTIVGVIIAAWWFILMRFRWENREEARKKGKAK